MVNPENKHTNYTTQTEGVVYRNKHVYAYVYITVNTINEQGGNGFERKQTGTCGRVGSEEREGENYAILI